MNGALAARTEVWINRRRVNDFEVTFKLQLIKLNKRRRLNQTSTVFHPKVCGYINPELTIAFDHTRIEIQLHFNRSKAVLTC